MWDVVWENLRSLANHIPYLRTPDRAGDQVTSLNSTEMNYGSERWILSSNTTFHLNLVTTSETEVQRRKTSLQPSLVQSGESYQFYEPVFLR